MELEVTRVLRSECPEHDNIFRSVFLIPGTIVKIEADYKDPDDTTEIMFSWGDEIWIKENVMDFKERVEKFNVEQDEKRRDERRDESLGI